MAINVTDPVEETLVTLIRQAFQGGPGSVAVGRATTQGGRELKIAARRIPRAKAKTIAVRITWRDAQD